VLVATPDYLERHGTPQNAQDLAQHLCLTMKLREIWHLIDAQGAEHDIRVSGPVAVSLGDAVYDWVRAGVGIGKVCLWHAGPQIRSGELIHVLPELTARPVSSIWAVRPPGRLLHARVKSFLDFMRDKIVQTNRDLYGDLPCLKSQNSG